MARLRVEQGKSQGKTVEFDKQAIVGRGETTQLQINDLKASREHFKVFEQAGTWQVADLNSTNGIKVNGVATTRKSLSHGDKIEVGETVMVFEMSPGAAKAVAASAADTGDMPAAKVPAPKGTAAPVPSRTAARPAAAAPAPAPRAGGAAAKKAAAMADARASAQSAKPARASAAAAAPAKSAAGKAAPTGQGVEVSDRVLQFHKVDTKKATVMDVDLTQSPGTTKFLIFLGCAAFLGLLAWLFSTLVQ